MRYQNNVIQSVPLHIRANHGMMLVREYTSCRLARSTLVMLSAKNSDGLQ